jgi:phage terminase large subunit GpA-like protein
LVIDGVGVDTGYRAETVYRVIRRVFARSRVFALKGISGEGPIVAKTSKQTTIDGDSITLHPIGVDSAKALVMARLSPKSLSPIRLNLSVTLEMCEQLTAERRITKYVRGFAKKLWVKTRDRNEMLDLMGYLLATLYIINPAWAALEQNRAGPPSTEPAEKPKPKQRKNWATNW